MRTIVVSLFDRTGNWPRPWASDPDTTVITVDQSPVPDGYEWGGRIHIQTDIGAWASVEQPMLLIALVEEIRRAEPSQLVVLMAPPRTDFASSGARYFKQKDADGTTQKSVALLRASLRLRDRLLRPGDVWALENPVGRLAKLVPELGAYSLIFHPSDYGGYLDPPGDAYTKRTCLWGNFVRPPFRPVKPISVCEQGSWIQRLGGKSEKTKFERSKTPEGFARAFWLANRRPTIQDDQAPSSKNTAHPSPA